MVKPRPPQLTVKCVDTYCELYRNLFVEVRSYNEQGLLHFLTESPWQAEELEKRRLEIIVNILEGREIIVIIDETGDKKKAVRPCGFLIRQGTRTKTVKQQIMSKDNILEILEK